MTLTASAVPAAAYDVALLDLDGVVYVGTHAVAHAVDCLAASKQMGMRHAFVTNNASRTPAEVAEHLRALGIPAAGDEVVTSSQAGASLLARRLARDTQVLAVGGPGVGRALAAAGLTPIYSLADCSGARPEAVMQGFGMQVTWPDLRDASLAVRAGSYWVATNLDRTLPIPGGLAPGNGMMVAAVAEAAGRHPDVVAGKPFAPLMQESVERTSAQRPLVVGDRLDTDIEGGRRLGIDTLLVMTGVTDVMTLLTAPAERRPDLVSGDLRGLLKEHGQPERSQDGWMLHESAACVVDGRLSIRLGQGLAGWEDAVRCACAAAWEHPDLDVGEAAAQLQQAYPLGRESR